MEDGAEERPGLSVVRRGIASGSRQTAASGLILRFSRPLETPLEPSAALANAEETRQWRPIPAAAFSDIRTPPIIREALTQQILLSR